MAKTRLKGSLPLPDIKHETSSRQIGHATECLKNEAYSFYVESNGVTVKTIYLAYMLIRQLVVYVNVTVFYQTVQLRVIKYEQQFTDLCLTFNN